MAWWLEEESSLALRDKRLTRTCFDSWTGYIQFNLRERVEYMMHGETHEEI